MIVDSTPTCNIVLTSGTKAVVRYLNLVGDRYLERSSARPRLRQDRAARLADPLDRTEPALDLDLLLVV